MAHRLHLKKVLVVLDDIDHNDHLEYLAGDPSWFGSGSRIIATTRDKHLIGKNVVYEMTTLADHEAIRLFNKYAFKEEVQDVRFEELTLKVVSHANGLPLALKVWGSFLYNRDETAWKSAIKQLKKNSNSKIVGKLKISYDGLEATEQEIFLDIACFLRGRKKDEIKKILESCDFEVDIGLHVLIDKSLLFLSENDTIEMHDLIQDMGKYILNMQKDPGERSRLWLAEDFQKVMINNMRAKAMEVVWFHYHEQLHFSKEVMRSMTRLRILYISAVTNCQDGSIEYLPNNLRWLVWRWYPWKSLPTNFEPKKLVHLELSYSPLCNLWKETKHLPCLRRLDLSNSTRLMQTPDFSGMPNLEYLNLGCCRSLEEVHHSLGNCRKLSLLSLDSCRSLKRFPCVNVESLEYLGLLYCSSLEKFPEILGRLKPDLKIDMQYCGIRELPSSVILYQTHITKLDLIIFPNLVTPPSWIGKLKSLVELNVSCCSKLESLPEEIGDLENLKKLDASCTIISRLPPSIVRLNKLKFLSFAFQNSEMPFVFPPVGEGLRSLEILNLSYCKLIDGGLPEDIGCLSSLEELNLWGNNFEHLPQSLVQLRALRSLDLRECKSLKQLPELPPELYKLYADCQLALKSIHNLVTMKKLQQVVLSPLYDEACNNSICNLFAHSLFKNLSSLSERVFSIGYPRWKIPSWFHYQGMNIIDLPENWYICDSFLGFAICYSSVFDYATRVQLIPLCNDGRSLITQKRANVQFKSECDVHFFFVPFAALWDESKVNGKTPNDYGHLRVFFSGEINEFGLRLLYKDEPTEHSIGIRSSGYDNSEHHDFTTKPVAPLARKKRSHSNIQGRMASVFINFAALSCKPKVLA